MRLFWINSHNCRVPRIEEWQGCWSLSSRLRSRKVSERISVLLSGSVSHIGCWITFHPAFRIVFVFCSSRHFPLNLPLTEVCLCKLLYISVFKTQKRRSENKFLFFNLIITSFFVKYDITLRSKCQWILQKICNFTCFLALQI